MTSRIILLLLISICQSDGLTYLGGNINWQPSLQNNKPDWIKISVNVNWLADPIEKLLCHQFGKEPNMDIAGYIFLSNQKSLKDFTKLRCNIVEMDRYIILSVRYQRLYKAKPSQLDVRIVGKLHSTDPNSNYWSLKMQGWSGNSGAGSPIVAAPPLVSLCYGSQTPLTYYLQAINLDSSLIQKCRWSTSPNECEINCATNEQKQAFQLNKDDCSLRYSAKTPFSMSALMLGKPQVLAITVESYKSGSSTTALSSTNIQFSVMEVPERCQDYGLEFSKTRKQMEFFQERCSSDLMQIPFDVTSTDTSATGLVDIKMVNGPPSSTLRIDTTNLISSPKRVTYVFEWKLTEYDDGAHPICFAVTHAGYTKYECSTITSYGTNSTISQPACGGRANCIADKFCVPFTTSTTQTTTTTTTSTQQQSTVTKQQTTATGAITRQGHTTTVQPGSVIIITQRTPANTQSTTKSTAIDIQPWMIGLPLGLLGLLALIAVLIALLIQQKKKKDKGKVQEMDDDDYIEPVDDSIFNHRPVQLRKFSTISEIMPNAVSITKQDYSPNHYVLKLFPDSLEEEMQGWKTPES